MLFPYVSRWISRDALAFQLWGVIAASPDAVSTFLDPEAADPETKETWNELRHHWESVRAWMSPAEWLDELSRSGNGISEEYDAVQEVEAASLEEAARAAFDHTVAQYGRRLELFPETIVGKVVDLGDPLKKSFPR